MKKRLARTQERERQLPSFVSVPLVVIAIVLRRSSYPSHYVYVLHYVLRYVLHYVFHYVLHCFCTLTKALCRVRKTLFVGLLVGLFFCIFRLFRLCVLLSHRFSDCVVTRHSSFYSCYRYLEIRCLPCVDRQLCFSSCPSSLSTTV